MRKRQNKVQFWLNDNELAQLNGKVKKVRLSREEFIRKAISNKAVSEAPPLEYLEILKNLRQINNNMNQIALRVNSGYRPDDRQYSENVAALQKQIAEIMKAVRG